MEVIQTSISTNSDVFKENSSFHLNHLNNLQEFLDQVKMGAEKPMFLVTTSEVKNFLEKELKQLLMRIHLS